MQNQIFTYGCLGFQCLLYYTIGGDFLEHTLFLGTISRLPVFQEVVVDIGANVEFTQQPAHAKFMMMFLDEPISL